MKRLGIELVLESEDSMLIVHYNAHGRPIDDGRISWATTHWSWTQQLTIYINNRHKKWR